MYRLHFLFMQKAKMCLEFCFVISCMQRHLSAIIQNCFSYFYWNERNLLPWKNLFPAPMGIFAICKRPELVHIFYVCRKISYFFGRRKNEINWSNLHVFNASLLPAASLVLKQNSSLFLFRWFFYPEGSKARKLKEQLFKDFNGLFPKLCRLVKKL